MNARFGALGPALHRAGWDVIPIKPKTKRPVIDGWQRGFTTEQVDELAANGYAGGSIGLLARKFPGADIDVMDQECADAIERAIVETLGPAPVRYGTAPKRLLMYTTDAPFSKVKVFLTGPSGSKGPDGKDFAVEFLGDGQQYVVYGEHPDGFEYRWPHSDGPDANDVWNLTTITLADVERLITSLPQYLPVGWQVRDTGALSAATAPLTAFENYKLPLEGWDLDRVDMEVLPYLTGFDEYEEWVRVGMALHHQFEADQAALDLWDNWSSQSSRWMEGACEEKWTSFSEQRFAGKGAVTLASLLKETKEAREAAVAQVTIAVMDDLRSSISNVSEGRVLEAEIAPRISANADLSDTDRAELAGLIQSKLRELGTRLPIGTIRSWLVHRSTSWFVHLSDEGHPLCTLENLEILLARLGITVRYNVISKQVEILVPGSSFTKDNKDNATIATVLSECEKVRMPTKHVPQFLLYLADANQYNPVLTWVESVDWDGTSRLEDFYATVVSDDPLKKMLMRKWLVQLIAAAASPEGIAGQGVLTFVGEQNIGKTTWFQRLAPPALDLVLTGHTLHLQNKDSILTAVRYWIVELGEVDATFRKSDVSALKSFITQHTDAVRRPYAMTESTYPRRTAFGASVNDQQFLSDPTGNRRFWTIEATGFQLDHKIDMQQLWAEVLQLWQDGERWFLDRDQVAALNDHNDGYRVADPIEERIAGAWAWPGEADRGAAGWEWITATDALVRLGIKDPKRGDTITAGRVIGKLNGGQRRKSNGRLLLAVPCPLDDFLG